VAVLPYDPERRVALLVRLPRAPALYAQGLATLLEAPAGMLDKKDEDPADCARREAMEEAGLRLGALEPIARTWISSGVMTERIQLYLAPYGAADRIGEGGGVAEEHEDITVEEISLATLAAMADAGEIDDLKTLTLIMTLRVRQPALFSI
jgi:nudix-type nucleoside diphosphatase (YffH/AdpP family)